MERRAFNAASEGAFAAMAPVALTSIPFPAKNALPKRVGRRGTGERQEQQHRMIGRGGVQFCQRRQALFGELRRVPAAHGRDEFPGRNRFRARGDGRLNVFDGSRRFEPRIVAGAQAEQHDVIVIVDQAGHRGAAVQVDGLGAGAELCRRKNRSAHSGW